MHHRGDGSYTIRPAPVSTGVDVTTKREFEADAWESVAVDPDPAADLGYVHEPLTSIHVEEDGERYIFLPGEDDHLTDAEFLIASPNAVRDLSDWE